MKAVVVELETISYYSYIYNNKNIIEKCFFFAKTELGIILSSRYSCYLFLMKMFNQGETLVQDKK